MRETKYDLAQWAQTYEARDGIWGNSCKAGCWADWWLCAAGCTESGNFHPLSVGESA
jgi:hypothetical protein